MIRRSFLGLASAIALAACSTAAPEPAPLGTARAAIRGGERDDGDPAVVAIVEAGGSLRCTATLVAPRVVLTAAHCFEQPGPLAARLGGTDVPLLHHRVHPGYDRLSVANDLAVALLASPSPTSPAALPTGPLSLQVGAPVRLVGFGRTAPADAGPDGAGDANVRRMGTTTISDMSPRDFAYGLSPASSCDGDSGGPVFLDTDGGPVLIGVTSYGDEDCELGVAHRTDAVLAELVAPYVALANERQQPTDASCLEDDNCQVGRCVSPVDAPGSRYCSAPCGPANACDEGFVCADASCIRTGPSPGEIGASCQDDGECDDLLCLRDDAAAAKGTCARSCVFGGSCDNGARCVASHDAVTPFICENARTTLARPVPASPASPTSPASPASPPAATAGCAMPGPRPTGDGGAVALALGVGAVLLRRETRRERGPVPP